jgi:hypothetical protein
MESIKPGIYEHYKGKHYQVYELCRHSETEEWLVVYRTLYGDYSLWVRPLAMFCENVTVNEKVVPRFQWIRDADNPSP